MVWFPKFTCESMKIFSKLESKSTLLPWTLHTTLRSHRFDMHDLNLYAQVWYALNEYSQFINAYQTIIFSFDNIMEFIVIV